MEEGHGAVNGLAGAKEEVVDVAEAAYLVFLVGERLHLADALDGVFHLAIDVGDFLAHVAETAVHPPPEYRPPKDDER